MERIPLSERCEGRPARCRISGNKRPLLFKCSAWHKQKRHIPRSQRAKLGGGEPFCPAAPACAASAQGNGNRTSHGLGQSLFLHPTPCDWNQVTSTLCSIISNCEHYHIDFRRVCCVCNEIIHLNKFLNSKILHTNIVV